MDVVLLIVSVLVTTAVVLFRVYLEKLKPKDYLAEVARHHQELTRINMPAKVAALEHDNELLPHVDDRVIKACHICTPTKVMPVGPAWGVPKATIAENVIMLRTNDMITTNEMRDILESFARNVSRPGSTIHIPGEGVEVTMKKDALGRLQNQQFDHFRD